MSKEKLEKQTIVCRITNDPERVRCDVYGAKGEFLFTKIVPRDNLKEILEK